MEWGGPTGFLLVVLHRRLGTGKERARHSNSWWRVRQFNFLYSLIEKYILDAFVIKAGLCCSNKWAPIPASYRNKSLSFVSLWCTCGFAVCHLHFRIHRYEAISSWNIASHHARKKRDQTLTHKWHIFPLTHHWTEQVPMIRGSKV